MPLDEISFLWPPKTTILGAGISCIGEKEAIKVLFRWLEKGGRRALVVTANLEILLWAKEHPAYREIINKGQLVVADGVGPILANKLLGFFGRGSPAVRRVPGRQLMEELCRRAAKNGWRVFLLGGPPGVAQKAAKILKEKFRISNFEFRISSWSGPKDASAETNAEWKETRKRINNFRPDFLFIAFGYPKPEEWLARHAKDLNFGVAMGVGGSFEYLAGLQKLPPKWVGNLGFEWLWRLLTQPFRWKRIVSAAFKFPLALLSERVTP